MNTGRKQARVWAPLPTATASIQIGLTHVPWNATMTFRYLYEFTFKDRFQGE